MNIEENRCWTFSCPVFFFNCGLNNKALRSYIYIYIIPIPCSTLYFHLTKKIYMLAIACQTVEPNWLKFIEET